MPSILWLCDAVVARLLAPALARTAVTAGLTAHAARDIDQPLKPYIRPGGRDGEHDRGRFIAMPAYVGGDDPAAGIKWIGGFPANVARGLPRASGVVVLNDTTTGMPVAVMECGTLSAMRTGAVAALCVTLFAPPGPRRLTVFGAGPIARAVIRAMLDEPNHGFEWVRVCDLNSDRAAALAAELAVPGGPPILVESVPEEAARGANVIVTATTGASGYIRRAWAADCRLFVALSLDDATPELFLAADKVVVDDFDQCAREEKLLHRLVRDGRFTRERVHAEIGHVLTGVRPGRETPGEFIYVNPMGMAVEDIATAWAVYRAARAAGVGQTLATS